MRDTIIVSVGTFAGSQVRHFERLRSREKRSLVRKQAQAPSPSVGLQQLINDIDQCVLLRPVDIDGTQSYQLLTPWDEESTEWPIGVFLHVELPGPGTIEDIKNGHADDFPFINPDALASMDGNGNASGGTPSNGRTALQASLRAVEEKIRDSFLRILHRRRHLANPRAERVRAILLASTFGGFGTGTEKAIRRIIRTIAQEMGLTVSFIMILTVPGANPSKDQANTAAVTCGLIQEQVASKYSWMRVKPRGSVHWKMVREGFDPAFLVSDMNTSPTQPVGLSVECTAAMVGEFLHSVVLTDVGEALDARLGDFNQASEMLTQLGEPHYGRSFGIATIFLDRERQYAYSAATLSKRFLESILKTADAEPIRQEAQNFLAARHLLEAEGRHDLSEHLLQRIDDVHLVCPDRLKQLFRASTASLSGFSLLANGRDRLTLAMEQTGDLSAALARRRSVVEEAVLADLDASINRRICDPQRGGLAITAMLLETKAGILTNLITAAQQETEAFTADAEKKRERIRYYEEVYHPFLLGKNWLYRFWHDKTIIAEAKNYASALENWGIAQMRQAAHDAAIETLTALQEPLQIRQSLIQNAIANVEEHQAKAAETLQRVESHNPAFGCPNGFSLLSSREDLDALHSVLLSEEEERHAVDGMYHRLKDAQPLDVLGNGEALASALITGVETTLTTRIENLHVVDELIRRHGNRPEDLGPVLRRRDEESFPFLPLADNAAGIIRYRVLGIDQARAGNLPQILGAFTHLPAAPYQLVNTADRDRIVFLQVAVRFPVSAWIHLAQAREIHDHAFRLDPFEKNHIFPGDRFLPHPGQALSPEDIHTLAFRAWALARLRYDLTRKEWELTSPDGTQAVQGLGHDLEVFLGQDGYRIAVDLTSHFNCAFLEFGPAWIEERIARLVSLKEKRIKADDKTESLIAILFDKGVQARIQDELAWWRKNIVPTAMEWGRAESRQRKLHALAGT